tara:strand:+ start:4759 stop:5046 length:288 start_codon:yes stop_codon:yes gene_type:complete
MSAYIIAEVRVDDPETYKVYQKDTPDTVKKFGGEFIVRGGDPEGIEGDFRESRIVIIKFSSRDKALSWYNSSSYQSIVGIRHSASEGRMVLVDGA